MRLGRPSHPSSYLLLFSGICLVYLCTLSDSYFGQIGDGLTMFNTAVSLHEFGELGIGPVFENGAMVRADHYGKYGLGFPIIMQLPLLAAAPLEKALGQGRSNMLFPLTNLLILATVPILIALCLRDLGCRLRTGLLTAAGFAFGTFAWPYISYDFSEPLQALCLIGAFWLLVRAARTDPPPRARLALAGFALGLAVLTKVTAIILIPSYAIYLWTAADRPRETRLRQALWFGAPLALWAGVIAVLNGYRFGSPFDFGYGAESLQFTTPLWTGLYGLWLSPNKGIIFYAPLAVLAPWGLWRMYKTQRAECIFLASVIALQTLVSATWWSWEGGMSWGPRLLLPVLPMVLLCAGVLLETARRAMMPFLACLAAGVAVNLLGVLVYFLAWESAVESGGKRIALDVRGRPAREYVEADGKKWFVPAIGTYYAPALSPIRGHAWLARLRYFDKPFPSRIVCAGNSAAAAPKIDFPPVVLDFTRLLHPTLLAMFCSANLWLWDGVSGKPRDKAFTQSLYGLALERQGDRALANGNLPRALETYKRAADLMPDYTIPPLKLAQAFSLAGKLDEAARTLTDILSRYPREAPAWFLLARLHDLTGNRAAALSEYRALLSLDPDEDLRRQAKERIASLQAQNR